MTARLQADLIDTAWHWSGHSPHHLVTTIAG
jgi:hypothetical protein